VTLADLTRGQRGRVKDLRAHGLLRQRLLDLGLVPGTPIQVKFVGRGGSPAAYYLRGSLFALRRETAEQILVELEGASL
jgi:ferrous iron transport protein A